MDEEKFEIAVRIAVKLIKQREGYCLVAYPDPDSPLSKELVKHGLLAKYKAGQFILPQHLQALSGKPWTIGYGQTKYVKQGDIWPQERAESDLDEQVRGRVQDVLKAAPNLANQAPERIAACVSLQYNIGQAAFSTSTVAKCIAKEDWQAAAEAFMLFKYDNGKVVQGLINRRKIERDLFLSIPQEAQC